MKWISRVIVIFIFIFLSGFRSYSRNIIQKPDTLRLQEQTRLKSDNNGRQGNGNAYGQGNRKIGSQSAKQLRNARPDMSRARGARPPMIVRPSGSGIPKGVGKPGGIGKKR